MVPQSCLHLTFNDLDLFEGYRPVILYPTELFEVKKEVEMVERFFNYSTCIQAD